MAEEKVGGWDLLQAGDLAGAEEYFRARLGQPDADFSDSWGLGRALLGCSQRQEALPLLQAARQEAVAAWQQGEIPYDLVEVIEKDIDRAVGDAESRILARGCDYLLGLLRIMGAMEIEEAVAWVERCAFLRLTPWWDDLVEQVSRDTRLAMVDTDLVSLPEVEHPGRVVARRRELRVQRTLTLDEIAARLQREPWEAAEAVLQAVTSEISGGNVQARQLLVIMANSQTFKEALQRIDILTRVFDLRGVREKWYALLFETWSGLPRWELAGQSLAEFGPDLWLGDLETREVAALLGLQADDQGYLYCPECGERVALHQVHRH
ncbi:MAG: hypothetical protein QHH05_00715 [Syntrophomonadaceae bacterium]|jgi:hypothetical protein|nr:hypothetical protein [Syntrophomonadaceae bacterium]MDH7496957.1 hypothetical protein [Syntrophomonadaceae bacterium]